MFENYVPNSGFGLPYNTIEYSKFSSELPQGNPEMSRHRSEHNIISGLMHFTVTVSRAPTARLLASSANIFESLTEAVVISGGHACDGIAGIDI